MVSSEKRGVAGGFKIGRIDGERQTNEENSNYEILIFSEKRRHHALEEEGV